jgi:hypothetical protein
MLYTSMMRGRSISLFGRQASDLFLPEQGTKARLAR